MSRSRLFILPAAVFLLYCVFILASYASGYPQLLPVADYVWFLAYVVGAKALFVVILFMSAFAAGGAVFSRWLPGFDSLLEEGLIKAALGLVVISYAVFILGLIGLLYPGAAYILLAACLASGARRLIDYLRRMAGAWSLPGLSAPLLILVSVAAYFLIKGFYGALLPPTGFDPLMYHLGVPKLYLDAHRIYPLPDVNGSYFPFGVEMLYLLGMMVDNVISANMVNYSFAVMGGLAAYLFTRRFVPGCNPFIAFAVYVSVPLVFWLMPQAYIELGMAAYAMLALYALLAALKGGKGWLMVAGILAGFTMAIKYTGVIIVAAMAIVMAVHFLAGEKADAKKAVVRAAAFLGLCLAVSAPWYVKNLIVYGNPVYPYLANIFGATGLASSGLAVSDVSSAFWSGGAAAVIGRFVSSLWRTTLDARAFQTDWSNGLGPYFLMFIPGILLYRKVPRELKYLMLFCLLFFLLTVSQGNVRYLAPIVPALSVLAAYPLGMLLNEKERLKRVFGIAGLGIFAFAAVEANTYSEKFTTFPSASPQAMDQYYQQGPWSGYLASYEAWQWINRNLPADAVIYQLWDEASVYFRERRTLGFPLASGNTGRHKIHRIQGIAGFAGFLPGEEIINNLKQMGAGYLLINANREGHAIPEDAYFKAHTRLILENKGILLFEVMS